MTSKRMPPYADLVALPEEQRIELMGRVAEQGKAVGFFVDLEPGELSPGRKGDRYLEQLRAKFRIRVISRMNAPVPGAEFISIGPTAGLN